jgi:cytosine/adenosine deaminase-related metal-dependent hydrolase
MLHSGITTFGAISSYSLDLEACINAKQNVIFFNELIGSQANIADILYNDFKLRLESSLNVKRKGFYSGVAIHSPYSVHPILIKKALKLVKEKGLRLSAHFMESKAEREWIDNDKGEFKDFFENFLKQSKAVTSADEFLNHFDNIATLFTHGVFINDKELKKLKQNNHTVIHCPISNRLLGNDLLDTEKLDKNGINWCVATDGLSSNYNLDLWEEMKISLFSHHKYPLLAYAKKLIDGVTINPAKALNLKKGLIQEGYDSDFIILDLDEKPNKNLAIHLIIHRYNISQVFINGKNQFKQI